ncbi:velum formation-related protein [Conoideocrella luteorostrata]|uniref:Velum formation-related protein n=1 Tax=Conoideocrella luteorostrata TaxID=1105319 RepID=A0AAJ0CHN4_9HYPO|nr:velum formation-related protein [Conoideocrella luteorostrata]
MRVPVASPYITTADAYASSSSRLADSLHPKRNFVKSASRVSVKDGKHVYELIILQQPERGRASGVGRKTLTDRRPIDPPTIVQLRIMEGSRDITTQSRSHFFLHASLESVCSADHGFPSTNAIKCTPELNGVSVSSMAHFRLPIEAGYFVFPDLAVNCEGSFRLNLNLFEAANKDGACSGIEYRKGDEAFDWRMEIKTQGFHVYRPAQFPGLTESSQLSKAMAEQGCRIRVRRSICMRRRGDKTRKCDESAHATNSTALLAPNQTHRSLGPELLPSLREVVSDWISKDKASTTLAPDRSPMNSQATEKLGAKPPPQSVSHKLMWPTALGSLLPPLMKGGSYISQNLCRQSLESASPPFCNSRQFWPVTIGRKPSSTSPPTTIFSYHSHLANSVMRRSLETMKPTKKEFTPPRPTGLERLKISNLISALVETKPWPTADRQ